jgi:hypothetical protein
VVVLWSPERCLFWGSAMLLTNCPCLTLNQDLVSFMLCDACHLIARRAFFILVIGFFTQVGAFLSWLFSLELLNCSLGFSSFLAHFFSLQDRLHWDVPVRPWQFPGCSHVRSMSVQGCSLVLEMAILLFYNALQPANTSPLI